MANFKAARRHDTGIKKAAMAGVQGAVAAFVKALAKRRLVYADFARNGVAGNSHKAPDGESSLPTQAAAATWTLLRYMAMRAAIQQSEKLLRKAKIKAEMHCSRRGACSKIQAAKMLLVTMQKVSSKVAAKCQRVSGEKILKFQISVVYKFQNMDGMRLLGCCCVLPEGAGAASSVPRKACQLTVPSMH